MASDQLSETGLRKPPAIQERLPNSPLRIRSENKVEAAYRRGDLLEKRRTMMEDWALFVQGQKRGGWMRKQPMTSGQRAIWRNVSARYPGVSEDVSNYFWKLADEDRLEVGTPEFVRMFLAKWPDGIDVIDLSNDRPDDGPKWTTDGELIQQWTLKVGEIP